MHLPYVSSHLLLLYGKCTALAMYPAKAQGLCLSRLFISRSLAPSSFSVSSWFQQSKGKILGKSMLRQEFPDIM